MHRLGQDQNDYTTTRENWELRLTSVAPVTPSDYTTTRENWELRPVSVAIQGL